MIRAVSISKFAAIPHVVLIFVGVYLDLGFALGDLRIPSASALFLILLLPGRMYALRASIGVVLVFTAVAAFSFIVGSEKTPVDKAVSSWVQTSWCIYIAALVFIFLSRRDRRVLRAGAVTAAALMFALGVLEVTGVLEAASAAFGEYAYGSGVGFNYYGAQAFALDRDLALAGFRRPTVFSPEPSTAALGFTVAVMMVYFLARKAQAALWSALTLFAAYSIFRSPTILVGAIAIIGHAAITSGGGVKKAGALLMALLLAAVAGYFVQDRLSKVSLDYEMMISTSEGLRLVLPFVNAWNSTLQGRVFGAGPGAQYDRGLITDVNPIGSDQFGTNIVALLLLYYGPVLLLLLGAVYFRMYKRLGLPGSAAVGFGISALLIGFSIGAIESARALGFLAILAAALAAKEQRRLCA